MSSTNQKIVAAALCALLSTAAAFAQSAGRGFETKAGDNGSVTIAAYAGGNSNAAIPASTGGRAAAAVRGRAFEQQGGLAGVTIPDGVIYTGGGAFAQNRQPSGVTPGSLFIFDNETPFLEEERAPWLRGKDAGNTGGRGKTLFFDYMCTGGQAGTYTPGLNDRTPKKDGDFEYIETRYGAALVKYNGMSSALRIPEQVKGLAVKYLHTGMFSGKPVERVLIPDSVTSIGNGAFSGCNLTTVIIGKNVAAIGAYAFFRQKLTKVIIPDSVTFIGDYAFFNNNLTSVTIGKNVAAIRARAFSWNALTSVVIPDSVTYIGYEAFAAGSTSSSGGTITSMTMGKNVATIGERAFYGQKLTGVVIPDSVTFIGAEAFASARSGGTVRSVTIGKNVATIGARAFLRQALTSVVIPDSVTYIGEGAFAENYKLTSVSIGSGVTMNYDTIPGSLYDHYNSNGKMAGVYTHEGGDSSDWNWTYTER